ncbi:PHD/FYVE-zinc-finger like domain-containing protein [Calycina marina]|uniref:PHD/FYVE-zinc-finger like domain-containing protein n=1 Tax=Calycina marina TaxID=1763456 RepID=A0A9P7Z309_9HELO|nr:PHD/FYVE-zinc-finger like domain-containing protein [Calycina marina]
MAWGDHVSNLEDSDEMDLLPAPSKPRASKGNGRVTSPPLSSLSHRFRDSAQKPSDKRASNKTAEDKKKAFIGGPSRPWEYEPYSGNTTVDSVLEELEGPNGKAWYNIEYEDGNKQKISIDNLIKLRNGRNALDLFKNDEGDMSSPEFPRARATRSRNKPENSDFVDTTKLSYLDESDESSFASKNATKKRRLDKGRVSRLIEGDSRSSSRLGGRVSSRLSSRPFTVPSGSEEDFAEETENEDGMASSRVSRDSRRPSGRNTRASTAKPTKLQIKSRGSDEIDELATDVRVIDDSEGSEIGLARPIVGRRSQRKLLVHTMMPQTQPASKRGQALKAQSSSSGDDRPQATRKSGRERHGAKSLREIEVDEEIYADEDVKTTAPKVISISEVYKPISKTAPFAIFHNKDCEVCKETGTSNTKGPLIYCQGCSNSIHRNCLGYRAGRQPIVTKVGEEEFVMQCRRCIGLYTKKDPYAPKLFSCQDCGKTGKGCTAFSAKKTAKQEEKMRLENDGKDPITEVSPDLINNAENLLFRCVKCYRPWHFEHLPPLSRSSKSSKAKDKDQREARLTEYADAEWECKDCQNIPSKVQGIVAWRAKSRDTYEEGTTIEELSEDEKEYLIKWEGQSYFACTWMPGAWVWGATVAVMRNSFIRREEGMNLLPKWTSEEAIPEAFLRMEIIFDVEYEDDYEPQTEEDDKTNISAVEKVLVKFLGLGYEESVWESPPSPGDGDRWTDFVSAYNEYVVGQYFEADSQSVMLARVDRFFKKKFVQLDKQPESITGELMPYQLEGVNWLLYNFHHRKNVILADEMGLGKTIQVVSAVAALIKQSPKCWPFLIVTPNSTCPNWRREFKKWAPGVRVVTFYGPSAGREMAMQYELFPNNCKDMRAHVVVTSYEGPVEASSRNFFKKQKWAGMIVDEGQRLKNDENLLYIALMALKIPFQALLTGTPLQNNKRELFNLLQFLDKSINAAELDEQYEELTNENIPELHDLIRPYFLRRTKVQVLKFLPPMAQVILPVSMSVVQKKLYKSILGKNPELIKTILGANKDVVSMKERGNLNNILMQLRKCLCHPFIYSSAIEERTVGEEALYRNLVDASSKFQLLEMMLPKLKERGHRVLLFSQFLDQLDLVEDFLNGLGLKFQRLDGKINALEKQKRIDQFNAEDSELFAFLLSTRAGGVGINLATADTVIIMDPDFNPHQDLQALSRAHRIGQKKKVLVFQLMTKDSAEEKIVQIGRKKMALDQALIESMDQEDDAGMDLETILAHGAAALFNDDDRNDIRYDSASIDKLLDRTQVENTKIDDKESAESQFSFARIWANDKGDLSDDVGDPDEEAAPPDSSVWEKILKQREADAAEAASKNLQIFGRGKRARHTVEYQRDDDDDLLRPSSPPMPGKKNKKRLRGTDEESDFGSAGPIESDKDDESEIGPVHAGELELSSQKQAPGGILKSNSHEVYVSGKIRKEYTPRNCPIPGPTQDGHFSGFRGQQALGSYAPTQNQQAQRHQQPQTYYANQPPQHQPYGAPVQGFGGRNFVQQHSGQTRHCQACNQHHVPGQCQLKNSERVCGLCGLAHFGAAFTYTKCPHLLSDIKIRLMLDALSKSTEDPNLVDIAKHVLLSELGSPKRPRRIA